MVQKKVRAQVMQRDKKCVECSSTVNLSLDHIIPLSKGGINTPDNLRVLCVRCNRRKGLRSEWKWWERVIYAFHVEEIAANIRNENKGERASLLGHIRAEISQSETRTTSDLRGAVNDYVGSLHKKVDGQEKTIALLTKRLTALEAHNKVKWVEETKTFEGYKKLKK